MSCAEIDSSSVQRAMSSGAYPQCPLDSRASADSTGASTGRALRNCTPP
ncbi:MAG: hypothetical protein RL030_2730, partial [Pseudomonadota bacterium]